MNSCKISFLLMLIISISAFSNCSAPTQGAMAPDIEAKLIDGTDFKLSELKGNYVILDYWGSWCGPCRHESPKLVALYNKYKSKKFTDAENLLIVSIALEKSDNNWKAFAEKMGFNWKHQIVHISKFVRFSNLAQKYSVTDLPAKFLISPKGELLSQKTLEEMDVLLASKSK